MPDETEPESGKRDETQAVNEMKLARLAMASDALTRTLLMKRAGRMRFGDDGDVTRDTWESLGYPEDVDFEDFLAKFLRSDVAGSIVDAPPKTTWREDPEIFAIDEDGNRVEDSEFENEVSELFDRLNAFHYFERVDRLCGIGTYAVLLIGSRDGDDLEAPLGEDTINGPEDIIYLSPYRQDHAEIHTIVTDQQDPRFGQVETYDIKIFGNRSRSDSVLKRSNVDHLGKSEPRSAEDGDPEAKSNALRDHIEVVVHHSRVIHVAEDLLEDEIEGRPRLERVWNRLHDLLKISGGSAEMFWQNVAGFWHGDIPAEADVDPDSLEDLEDDVQDAIHGLSRVVLSRSLNLDHIGGDTPDPRGVWEVLKNLIAAGSGQPQRQLFGSERGELASSQDEAKWFSDMANRQKKFAGPMIIREFVDRMVEVEAVTPPDSGRYGIQWPDLFQLTDLEKAELAANVASAAKSLTPVGGDPTQIVSANEIREIVGLPPKENVENESLEAAVLEVLEYARSENGDGFDLPRSVGESDIREIRDQIKAAKQRRLARAG